MGVDATKPLDWFACGIEAIDANGDFVIALASVFIAIFTATLWGATKRLWQVANRQMDEMRPSIEATREMADAAKDNAIAARKLAEISHQEMRPYVRMSHDPPGLHGWVNEPNEMVYLCLDLEVKNWGRTPAKLLEIRFKFEVIAREKSLPDTPNYETDLPQISIDTSLISMDFMRYRQPIRLTTGDAHDVRNGSKRLYVYGFVRYSDHFGGSYCAGYGRIYKKWRDIPENYDGGEKGPGFLGRSNLAYMSERGYNDDRIMEKPESK